MSICCRRLTVVTTLASIAVAMLTVSAQAEKVFAAYGGKGDRAEQIRCPDGYFLTGLHGKTGLWIDQVGLICHRFKGKPANRYGESRFVTPRGGNGGAWNPRSCDKDLAINSIEGSVIVDGSTLKYVRDIRFSCSRPPDGATANEVTFGGTYTPQSTSSPMATIPGITMALGPHHCRGDQYATGLNLRYGQHVNAVGLICNTFHSADPPLFGPPQSSASARPGMEVNTDRPGSDRHHMAADDPEFCRLACVNDRKHDKRHGCRAWTYVKPGLHDVRGVCYLKNPAPNPVTNTCCISGVLPRELPSEPWRPRPEDEARQP
jgi:hypothetical protein